MKKEDKEVLIFLFGLAVGWTACAVIIFLSSE